MLTNKNNNNQFKIISIIFILSVYFYFVSNSSQKNINNNNNSRLQFHQNENQNILNEFQTQQNVLSESIEKVINCTLPKTMPCPPLTTTQILQYCQSQTNSTQTNFSIIIPSYSLYQNCTESLTLNSTFAIIQSFSNLSNLIISSSYVFISTYNVYIFGGIQIEYDQQVLFSGGISTNINSNLFSKNQNNQNNIDDSFNVEGGQMIVLENIIINVKISQSNNDTNSSSNFYEYNQIMNITFLNSIIKCQKILIQSLSQITMKNTSITTHQYPCLYSSLNIQDYQDYIKNTNGIDLKPLSINTQKRIISVFFLVSQTLSIQDSQIKAGVMFLIAQQEMNVVDSQLNATAMACRSNMGPGRGLAVQMGNNYCMSGSSSSGYGMVSNSLDDFINNNTSNLEECQSILQYFMFLTHAFPYQVVGPYLITGSGGYGYTLTQRGAGGGIIFMYTQGNINQNNSYIGAEGGPVSAQDFGTGGSGGTVYQYAGNMISGNFVNISANGGASYNNNGSGAGGIVKIGYESYLSPNDTMWINVSQGYQPSSPNLSLYANGIFYGPQCPLGTWMYYFGCIPCPAGTYSGLGDTKCKACPQTLRSQINLSSTMNTNLQMCYNKQQKINSSWLFVPGNINFITIIVYMACLVLFIIVGIIITHKMTKKKSILETQQFNFQNAGKQMSQNNIITQELKNDKNFRLADLMYHIHRITLNGCNSYRSPWMLILNPPQQIREFILKDAYHDFARKFNKVAKWSFKQKLICRILMLIYPLYWYYYISIKKSKFKKILALVQETKQFNFLNNYQYQDTQQILMKVSKNTDYTILYMDFFVYKKTDLKYFLLTSPFIVWLSGQGTFIRPFYICQQDIFLTVLFFTINRNFNKLQQVADQRQKLLGNLVEQKKRQQNTSNLIQFIHKFNIVCSTLDLASPSLSFFETILQIIKQLKYWNIQLFNRCMIMIDFILVFSETDGKKIKASTITLLTDKNPQKLKEVMKQISSKINANSFFDIKFGLFIYNPQQQIVSSNSNNNNNLNMNLNLNSQQQGLNLNLNNHKMMNHHNGQKILIGNADDQNYITDILGYLTQEILERNDGYQQQDTGNILQDSTKSPLLNKNSKKEEGSNPPIKISSKKISIKHRIFKGFITFTQLIRYYMLSHRLSKYDKYLIKFLQSLLILFQAMLVFIWSIKIQFPYIFINMISPFIGIIWIVSDSYGIGKTFLMLNAMLVANLIFSLILYEIIMDQQLKIQIAFCQITNLVIAGLVVLIGTRSITYSRKLNSPQMFN